MKSARVKCAHGSPPGRGLTVLQYPCRFSGSLRFVGRATSGLKGTVTIAPGRLTGAKKRPGPAPARPGGLAQDRAGMD